MVACKDPEKEKEHRRKLQESNKKTWSDPELLKKHSDKMKVVMAEPEVKQKQSDSIKRAYRENPDLRLSITARNKILWADEEFRADMCEKFKKRSQNPEWIKNHREMVDRVTKTPEWIQTNKIILTKVRNDPNWLPKMKRLAQERASDPIWLENTAKRNRELAKDPEWIKKHNAITNDPVIKEKMIKGIKESWNNEQRRKDTSLFFSTIERNENWCKRIGDAHRGENCSFWKGGISFLPYHFLFNNIRKKATRRIFGHCCICCGKHVTENISRSKKHNGYRQKELHVHHITHDKEQGCEGKPFTLVPLCDSCHAKEKAYQEEYIAYINKTLAEGFKWGIWSKEQYMREVMYPE